MVYRNSSYVTTILLLAVSVFASGCSDATKPEPAARSEFRPGEVLTLESSRDWSSSSIAWRGRDVHGVVPRLSFSMISRNRLLAAEVGSRYFEAANVLGGCDSGCFPALGAGWFEASLPLADLAASPTGGQVAFGGLSGGAPWVYVMPAAGGAARRIAKGHMPDFASDGSWLIYVNEGKTVLRRIRIEGGEPPVDLVEGTGIEYPRLSPDGRHVAYSAIEGSRGRRILVLDLDRTGAFADPVSDATLPNFPSRDGNEDNLPTWSPGGEYVAYASVVQDGNQLRTEIFVVAPAAEPEVIVSVHEFGTAEFVTDLRWHPVDGSLLLSAVANDVRLVVPPERFWDAAVTAASSY